MKEEKQVYISPANNTPMTVLSLFSVEDFYRETTNRLINKLEELNKIEDEK